MRTLRASLWKLDNWFIAECLEADIATQAGSEPEAFINMREALALHFDVPEQELIVEMEYGAPQHAQFRGARAERTFLQVRGWLEAHGFRGITQKPNHAKFLRRNDDGGVAASAVLPHYTELSYYVVYSVLRQAGFHPDEFHSL